MRSITEGGLVIRDSLSESETLISTGSLKGSSCMELGRLSESAGDWLKLLSSEEWAKMAAAFARVWSAEVPMDDSLSD